MPVLEGKKPQDVATLYTKSLATRSTKAADALGKLEAIPADERTDVVKKLPSCPHMLDMLKFV